MPCETGFSFDLKHEKTWRGWGEGGGDHVKADHDDFSYTLYR